MPTSARNRNHAALKALPLPLHPSAAKWPRPADALSAAPARAWRIRAALARRCTTRRTPCTPLKCRCMDRRHRRFALRVSSKVVAPSTVAQRPRQTVKLRGAPYQDDYYGVTIELPETIEVGSAPCVLSITLTCVLQDLRAACIEELGLPPDSAIRMILAETRGEVRSVSAVRDNETIEVEIIDQDAAASLGLPPRTVPGTGVPARPAVQVPTAGPSRYQPGQTTAGSNSAPFLSVPPAPGSSVFDSVRGTPVPTHAQAEIRYPLAPATTNAPRPLSQPHSPEQRPTKAAEFFVNEEPAMMDFEDQGDLRERAVSPTLTPVRGPSVEPAERVEPARPAEEPRKLKQRIRKPPPHPTDKFVVRVWVRRHKDRVVYRVPINLPLNKRLIPALPKYFPAIKNLSDVELLIRESENHYRKVDVGLPPNKLGWLPGQEIKLVLALPISTE